MLAENDTPDALSHLAEAMAESVDFAGQLVGGRLVDGHCRGQDLDIRHAGHSIADK
jgi:hypothetical protein